jgi:hypothetical protein
LYQDSSHGSSTNSGGRHRVGPPIGTLTTLLCATSRRRSTLLSGRPA